MEFKNRKFRERKQQNFDKEKIVFEKQGKKINVYDFIQEGREDTEIYPTLEKYGCIDKMMLNREDIFANYTEIQGLKDLRGLKELEIKSKQMFYNLPPEIRQEFDNDINKFTKNGEKYLKEKVNAYKAEDAKIAKQAQEFTKQIEIKETVGA